MNYTNMKKSEIFQIFESNDKGLTENEALKRLKKYGPNSLSTPKPENIIIKFLKQFNDFMTLILITSAVISIIISYLNHENDYIEPVIIMAIVVLNSIIGVIQESKAEHSINALKKLSAPTATVMRAGKSYKIEASKLVPGDIIYLEAGDIIPADSYILSSFSLSSDESSLTGESVPSEKYFCEELPKDSPVAEQHNILHSSCIICQGRAVAMVVATGQNTQVGNIANMIINDEAPRTPLQNRLEHIGKVLGIACIVICIAVFVLGIIHGIAPLDMFMTSVSLAVAAIPEGLTIIVTIMLSIGVTKMSKANAIVRNLPAVETLGSTSCICSDKTGTLTANSMTVTDIRNALGSSDSSSTRQILLYAMLCCNSTDSTGDPTEQAIVRRAANMGISTSLIKVKYKRKDELPFDSSRKMMSTITKMPDGSMLLVTKGAFDVLICNCSQMQSGEQVLSLTSKHRQNLVHCNEQMAAQGLRVIAVAYKTLQNNSRGNIENNLTFLGLIGMIDPPRPNVEDSIRQCRTAGIRTVMITGDHPVTALAIAKQLGITENEDVITGQMLSNMDDSTLRRKVKKCNVYARVTPEHKVRIVKAMQDNGIVTAMTGDGVNDAPALKRADIGCSMGLNGTDVARNASDIILTDDNFTTIVSAVREGRRIYSNIRKTICFLLSSNIGEILTIFISIVFNLPVALTAVELLWINLVTDSLPAISLGLEPEEDNIMSTPPVKDPSKLFDASVVSSIIIQGLMIGILALSAFMCGYRYLGNSTVVGRTMAFTVLGLSQLFHSFNMKSSKSLFSTGIFNNMYLVGSFFICLALQLIVTIIPALQGIFGVVNLSLIQWLTVIVLSFLPIPIVELQKKVNNRLIH